MSRKVIGTRVAPNSATMVTRARGRFINRPTKTGRGIYDKFFIYIPTELARDSSFPLKPGQEVDVQIDQEKRVLVAHPVDASKRGKPLSSRRKVSD